MNKIPSPNDTGLLRAIVGCNQYAAMPDGEIGPEPLVVNACHIDEANQPKIGLDALLAAIRQPGVCRSQCLHTYLGGLNLADETDDARFPFADLPIGLFAGSEMYQGGFEKFGKPPLSFADISQRDVRKKMVELIAAEAQRRKYDWGYTGVFIDNIAHPSMGSPFDWADTIEYLANLYGALHIQALHNQQMTLWVNVALAPGHKLLPLEDVQALADVADAVSLEMGISPNYIDDLASYVQHWDALTSKGVGLICDVLDAPVDQWPAEGRFAAHVAMILQNTYVAYPQDQPRQDWFAWPTLYGAPTGPIAIDGRILSRQFGRVVMLADFDKRTAEVK